MQVDGLLLADNELVRDGLREAYLDAYSEAAREGFNRQAAAILDRAGIEVTWQQVEAQARQVLEDLSFQASQRLMQRITGDVKGAQLRGVGRGVEHPGDWQPAAGGKSGTCRSGRPRASPVPR